MQGYALLISDEVRTAESFSRMLEDSGWLVFHVRTAANALALLSIGCIPDVVVVDMDLGGSGSSVVSGASSSKEVLKACLALKPGGTTPDFSQRDRA